MSTIRDEDVIVIFKGNNKNKIWCQVCNYVLNGSEDIQSNKENKCCSMCWVTFGESRRKDWKNGWRPDKETLKRYKSKRSILNVSIEDIVGE